MRERLWLAESWLNHLQTKLYVRAGNQIFIPEFRTQTITWVLYRPLITSGPGQQANSSAFALSS